jgi:phage antirepressor YoqD-like protein
MPYRPTGRPSGRPRKQRNPEEEVVTLQIDVRRPGVDYLDRRAAALGTTRHEVIKAALREYAERHPVRPS